MVSVAAACSSTGDGGEGGTGGIDPTGTNSNGSSVVSASASVSVSASNSASASTGVAECVGNTLTVPDAVCQACLEQPSPTGCCTELVTCSTNTACTDLLECEAACAPDDQLCVDTCLGMHPEGVTDLDALDACFGGPCAADCGGGGDQSPICDSGIALNGTDAATMACAACLGAPGCCEDFTACANDADCTSCVLDGVAAACGKPLDAAVDLCFGTTCAAECG